jgi:hypothetical protein
VLALLPTSGSLALLGTAPTWVELVVLVAAGLLPTGIRFTIFRTCLFPHE